MCVVMLFVIGAVFRHWAKAQGAVTTMLLALHTNERRVRIEFHEERVRMEAEYFRGEGTWKELDEVAVFPGFWVLYLSNAGPILVPASALSAEPEALTPTEGRQGHCPAHPSRAPETSPRATA